MSIFSSIGKAIKSVGSTVFNVAKSAVPAAIGYAVGGPAGAALAGGLGGFGGSAGAPAVVSGAGKALATIPKQVMTLPGAGTITKGLAGFATGAAAGTAVGTLMSDGTIRRRRRRRRGITATELKNHRRVEYFLSKNFKCKHGGTRGSYVRRRASR